MSTAEIMDKHDSSARTADDELSHSHASDDPEDADSHLTANDGVTDYENDEPSNSGEDIITSISPSENQLTESSSRLLAVNDRLGEFLDGDNSLYVPVRQNLVGNSAGQRIDELTQMNNVTKRGPVDGNHNLEGLSSHIPANDGISPSEDFDGERDPNYATQRPDTLGAINVSAAAANAFVGPARPVYQAATAPRAWTVQSGMEDGSYTDDRTSHLGRRTCGAGMDQLELNQRQLMNADIDDEDDGGDGSEFCDDDDDDDDDDDVGLGNVNQCESTEADQYKMDPEADQTAGVVGTELQENGGARMTADDVRPGAQGSTLGRRRRTDGAVSDVSYDMDDPEEDQADRAVSADNSALEHAALVSLPADAANALPVVCDDHQYGALKRHPQSAFSVPKPRPTKSKPVESDSAAYSDRPVPSVRHSKSNTDIVFKPISSDLGISDPVTLRTLITSKSSGGSNVTGIMHGESQCSMEKKRLSARDGGISSEDKKDAGGNVESEHHHHPRHSKHAHDVNSAFDGRCMWSRETLWNDVHTYSSLPSASHLPGEGGSTAVGTFAPANSSSQQATPEKTDSHACHMLDNSIGMSPIQPASSFGSRPLSVNGFHAVDSASVNYMFPSTEFSIGIQGSLPQNLHKVGFNLLLST